MKVVYIAHPIGGDVSGNIEKINAIVRHLNLSDFSIVPFVPYLSDLLTLDDNDWAERQRGILNSKALFKRGVIDEVWLYGGRISAGMMAEIELAKSLNIPVIDKDNCLKEQL